MIYDDTASDTWCVVANLLQSQIYGLNEHPALQFITMVVADRSGHIERFRRNWNPHRNPRALRDVCISITHHALSINEQWVATVSERIREVL